MRTGRLFGWCLPYSKDDAKPWSLEARGETFTRPNKAAVSCWVQGSKQYVYSKHRLLTPLKRVDFDPDGKRNPQNRGISGYEPISWDEAVKIVTKEIIRIKKGRPLSHSGDRVLPRFMGEYRIPDEPLERFWNLVGCTWIDHNPESWEDFFWSYPSVGLLLRLRPPAYDLLDDTFKCGYDRLWSSDPSTTSGDYAWNETDNWRFHMKKLGIKFVFIDPFCNYQCDRGDKWLSRGLAPTVLWPWPLLSSGSRRAHDKGYVKPIPMDSINGRPMFWVRDGF
jgi:trimethylamine-N-oxide reductase (cytochrome c)